MPNGNGRIKLSANFWHDEFECSCGCGDGIVSNDLIELLQALRVAVGPLLVTSGIRCKSYNKRIGGAGRSWHCPRNGVSYAADITYLHKDDRTDYNILKLWVLADLSGAKGIGLYKGRLHVDQRPTEKARWIDKSWAWKSDTE